MIHHNLHDDFAAMALTNESGDKVDFSVSFSGRVKFDQVMSGHKAETLKGLIEAMADGKWRLEYFRLYFGTPAARELRVASKAVYDYWVNAFEEITKARVEEVLSLPNEGGSKNGLGRFNLLMRLLALDLETWHNTLTNVCILGEF